MKIIFLDVDGVLNCATTKERVRDLLFVEDRKVQLLKELVDETGATIILSSTWRLALKIQKSTPNSSNSKTSSRNLVCSLRVALPQMLAATEEKRQMGG